MSPHVRALKVSLGLTTGLCVAALLFFAWQYFYPVQAAAGWSYRVAYDGVMKPAAMAHGADGSLLLSQELSDGEGNILQLYPDGRRQVLVAGLSKPDGLLSLPNGLVFSQEAAGKTVSLLRDGRVEVLFQGENVQGLWEDGDSLYAIEDRKGDGRLWRYRWADQQLSVVREHMTESESITRCGDGRVLYTEKANGVIRELTEDDRDPVVLEGLHHPTFLLCDARGLWISEDSNHRARVLLIDAQGQRHTMLSYLKSPQSILPLGAGRYLVAEGGRGRVLELSLD